MVEGDKHTLQLISSRPRPTDPSQSRQNGPTHPLLEVAVEEEGVVAAGVAQHVHVEGHGAVGVVEVEDGLGRAAEPRADVLHVGQRGCRGPGVCR